MSNAVAGKLIQIIKSYPVLYDPNNADYRSKEVVEPLWQEIALDLNENDMELRKRWRNLRDTYVKLLRLIKNSENDEVFRAAAIRKYYKWIWTREMEFFRPYLTLGNKLGDLNINIAGVENTIEENILNVKSNRRLAREVTTKPKRLKEEVSTTPPAVSSSRKSKQLSTFSRHTKVVPSTRSVRLRKLQEQEAASNSDQTELDATDRLFLAHSQSIKQFSARRQAITKLKIAEVIMEQEILEQEEKDFATNSITSTKSVNKRKYKETHTQDEDAMLAFETVCGYETDEGGIDEVPYNITDCKREIYEEDPVDDDDF